MTKPAKYLLTLSQIVTTILMAIALYIILKGTLTMNPIIIFNGLFVLLGSWVLGYLVFLLIEGVKINERNLETNDKSTIKHYR